ncbi:hypothetical protein cypCar_00032545, partial [Cyprinus carpio]
MIEDASDLSNFTKEILDCGYTGRSTLTTRKSMM